VGVVEGFGRLDAELGDGAKVENATRQWQRDMLPT
jgi:hypothetical protein